MVLELKFHSLSLLERGWAPTDAGCVFAFEDILAVREEYVLALHTTHLTLRFEGDAVMFSWSADERRPAHGLSLPAKFILEMRFAVC